MSILSRNGDKKSLERVFDCHLSPFDCRLLGVLLYQTRRKNLLVYKGLMTRVNGIIPLSFIRGPKSNHV